MIDTWIIKTYKWRKPIKKEREYKIFARKSDLQEPFSLPILADLRKVELGTFVSFCLIWNEFELSEKSLPSEQFVLSEGTICKEGWAPDGAFYSVPAKV